jgi:hypothetical protein
LVKEIVDASIEVKSISDCIDDCEYGAAKKLLKRHKKSIEETTKRVKKMSIYNIIDRVGS